MWIKNKLLPFLAAFAVLAGGFLVMDIVLMNLQGLSLIFHK